MLRKKKRVWTVCFITLFLLLAGCGEKKAALTDGREVYVKDEEQKEEVSDKKEQNEKLFVVTGLDTVRKKITLKGYKEEEETEYNYTGATYIKDKYGTDITMRRISCGEMVNAQIREDTVASLQVSDKVFTYDDICSFTIDTENNSITVGKSVYCFEDDIQVFYNNNKISVGEISRWDTICLKGIEKKVYAIQVTSGHGTVVLKNTDLFEGGNITIGNVMSLEITKDMKIEVPEGTYLLSVANDGYGGSCDITVEANYETTVDLEALKGEGPKIGTIAFKIEPENATLYLNGEVVDLSQTLQLKYGKYTLRAKAEGYVDWKRTLVVNSERANIKIELQTVAEAEAEKEQKKESLTETLSGKEQEEAVKKAIQEIRNNTLSTSDSSAASGTTSKGTQ